MKNILSIIICLLFIINVNSQCLTDSHSPFKNQGWLSCDISQSPNLVRGTNHWLMYDLGHKYIIDSLTIWNHNVWGETGSGAKTIEIDVSNDKTNWNNLGTFTINKAPGSWKYQTDNVLQLNNTEGQYFLITVVDAWDINSTCRGIAEVKFGVGMSTSTEDTLEKEEWSVYPNPTIDNITIDLQYKINVENISIINALGQVVKNIKKSSVGTNTISVTDLEDGIYFVRVSDNEKVENKSFVKMSN